MKKILFSLLCTLFLFTACSDDDERSEIALYLRIPETVKSLHYLKDVQGANIVIETNSEDWTITSDKDWCDVHRIISNSQVFRLTLNENEDVNQREAKLTLKASGITETITVKQLGTKPAILINPEKLENISGMKKDYELVITTNVSSIKWDIQEEDQTWLSITEVVPEDLTRAMVDKKYTLTAQSNNQMDKRSSTIVFTGTGDEEEHPTAELTVSQDKRSTDIGDVEVGEDTKIIPGNAWASSEQPSQPIKNAYDTEIGDDAPYHTLWGDGVQFPVTLEFYFDGTQDMDYIVYYANNNNKFKKVKVYYLDSKEVISFDQDGERSTTSPSEGKYWIEVNKEYTLQETKSAQRITFPERLQQVTGIKIEVEESYGSGAACNEMEFYLSNASHLEAQLLGVFKDITCSELNDNITDEDINNLPGYFAQLAFKIKEGSYSEWEKKFRIQDYTPYSAVADMANAMLIKKYGNQDNMTGIYVEAGDNIIVLVGDTHNNDISLQVLGEETVKNDDGSSYVQTESPTSAQTIQLTKGVNKVTINKAGMLFILYTADPTNAQNKPIRVHIPYESGKVSGFFDLETDKTDAKYTELLDKADYKYFGVRGKDIIFYFHTSQLRKVAPNNIVAAIELWDAIVGWQHEIMGFSGDLRKKYNNHIFAISPEGSYMWQSEYRVGFVYTYLENILLPENVKAKEDNAWGPAHEIGHIHQKAINWPGCSESSNNLFSNYVIYKMGKYYSRGYGLCRVAKTRFVDNDPWVTFGEATHQNEDTEIHMRMYWQLFVYYHLCKNNKDFWPDVFAKMREKYAGVYTESNPGKSQMMFVEAVCEVANEDLTDFFDFWGFFTPVDLQIDQYGKFTYTVTESMINTTKSNIAKYKKAAPIQYIEDRKKEWFEASPNEYRDKESGDVGYYTQFQGAAETFDNDAVTATMSGKEVTVDSSVGSKSVSFEVRKGSGSDGELVYFSNDFKFTLPDNIKTAEVKLWAVQSDGARKSIKVN
ncbi:M60 family metallopeptidase [Bacteroides sp.]|uniref:M60 family metallopeptidase n=1 Tax=Bacteroides sp. TaxID=29523 RepID=UPI0025B9C542|nr:M60 family metallopeptidase [Bacteroides sp.]